MDSKIISYMGFSVKARKYIVGASLISAYRKKIHLIMLCASASDNTKKDAHTLATRFGAPLVLISNILLEDIIYKSNAKIMALTDFNLAKSILQNISDNENFKVIEV
ncbi:MAG: hypothetical protein FWB72_00660 [Firmicutes bacterium]|nr:hypothetical protein [Bacillota bacterium]